MKSLTHMVPSVGIATACFLAFMLGMWVTQKEQRHEPSWRNACTLTDANGGPLFDKAPAELFASK